MPTVITETVSVIASKAVSPPASNGADSNSKPQPTYAQISQASAGEKKAPKAYYTKPRAPDIPKKVEAPFEPQKNKGVKNQKKDQKKTGDSAHNRHKVDLEA